MLRNPSAKLQQIMDIYKKRDFQILLKKRLEVNRQIRENYISIWSICSVNSPVDVVCALK